MTRGEGRSFFFGMCLFLLGVALFACGQVLQRHMPEHSVLPPLPAYLETPVGNIPVGKVDSLVEKKGAIGMSDYLQRIILLDSRQSLNTAWLTLEHERVHFIFFDAGIYMDKKLEEIIADTIAAARVAEMLRARK